MDTSEMKVKNLNEDIFHEVSMIVHSVQLSHHETFSKKFNARQSRLRKRNTLTFYSFFVILSFIYIRYFRFMATSCLSHISSSCTDLFPMHK